jgi:hypothetical protein
MTTGIKTGVNALSLPDLTTADPEQMRETARLIYELSRWARYRAAALQAHGCGWTRLARGYEDQANEVWGALPAAWRRRIARDNGIFPGESAYSRGRTHIPGG